MNCSLSRLRRGTMLVLLVPANSHITDSRSITRALQTSMSYFWKENTKNAKKKFWNVYLPVSAVLVLTLWSHSIEQLQNQGFPPRRNSAVKSERRKMNPRWLIRYAGCCVDLFNGFVPAAPFVDFLRPSIFLDRVSQYFYSPPFLVAVNQGVLHG